MISKLKKWFEEDPPLQSAALIDDRPPTERQKDYKFEELVASADPVLWEEKAREEWRKFPIFNQNGSGSCFHYKTQVLMADFTYKPIGEVAVGEHVITHTGARKPVIRKFKRKWQGVTYRVKVYGLPDDIEATAEHPFLTRSGWKKASKLCAGDFVAVPTLNNIVEDKTLAEYEYDKEFLWTLGLYLAEGSLDTYCVNFTLSKDELSLAQRAVQALRAFGGNAYIYSHSSRPSVITVKLQGERWVEIFRELGGEYCNRKRIHRRLMSLDPNLQLAIYEGWKAGDGHIRKNRTIVVSTSYELIMQMYHIILRNGLRGFIQRRAQPENRLPSWNLCVVEKKTKKRSGERYCIIEKDFAYVRIQSVIKNSSFSGGHVYNLEVADDNTYIVSSVAVHNCVAQSSAKMLGINYWLKNQSYVHFSATDIYQRRRNRPQAGMHAIDALDILTKGVTLEELVPSQNMTDAEMDSVEIPPYKRQVGDIFRVKNYVILPTQNIDTVASTIQKTGKGVMVWFYFRYDEWTNEPTIIDPDLPLAGDKTVRHSVVAVDFTTRNGKKGLVVEDSWGKNYGWDGQRFVSEDFYQKRNFFAGYTLDFRFEESPQKTKYYFVIPMSFSPHTIYLPEVKELQNFLKEYGYFPRNIESSGYYGAITAKAVKKWQVDNWQKFFEIDQKWTKEELEKLEGKSFGKISIQVANNFIS